MNKIAVKIGSLKLSNPVMVASGTFGYAGEFEGLLDIKRLGAIVTKTITLKARKGNLPPRTCEVPAGMLNSIGLENPGVEEFIKEKLPLAAKYGVPVIVSISAENDPQELTELARRLDGVKEAAAIELNISCPNIKLKGKSKKEKVQGKSKKLISQDPQATYDIVKKVRKVTRKTLITKLSPNVTDISEIALAAEGAGSDAVALINTLTGMRIDVESRTPLLGSVTGGLSGPGIRPVAVRMVWECYKKIKIPIVGMGGIIDLSSALEFIIAGASAVSIGTANFINPAASAEIIAGLTAYLKKHKIKDVSELVGSLGN
jgi:dihydroorotate dehydrogenase (NAD+) catalytic subunit